VLYEFAMTPDVFDTTVVDADPTLGIVLVQLLRGMCDNGLIANLHRDRWARHVMEHRLTRLSPALRDKVIACLNTLHDRHRLVRHPRRMQGDPIVDGEWLELALESHRRIPFHSIILSKALLSECADSNIMLTELSGAQDPPQWQSRRRSFTLTKCDADYRAALAPILRHARTLTLIDPYMSCRDSRFFNTVKICIDLLGQRGHAILPARIHIHAGNPQDNYHHPESIVNRLNAWKQCFRPLMDTQHPHHFKVFLWEAHPGSETFHDRYILTDQCGISVPSGLDCRADSVPNSTTWSLLDEEDRTRRLQDFDPATSSFRLLGEREVL
jgi:hypothetical protein